MRTSLPVWEDPDPDIFRLLVENVRDYAVFALDAEGRVLSWSSPAEHLLGYRACDIVGQPAERFYTPEDIADGVPDWELQHALAAGWVEEERWYVRQDGSRFCSRSETTPLLDADRGLRGFAKVVHECTDAKQAEDALVYAAGIVETVREPLIILDGRLRVQSANRSFYRTFGMSPGETEGRRLYELGNGQWDIPRLRALLKEVLPQHASFDDLEVERDFPTVGRKFMRLNARRLRQGGADTALILLAIEDVSARRQAEEERRESETRFTSLVKNLKDHAVFTLDPEGRVTSWNSTAEYVLGYTEAEVLGRHFAFIFTPEDRQQGQPEAELQGARESGRAEDERWHLRKDGERFCALGVLGALYDAEGGLRGFSKILRDITDRKRGEEALAESAERLRAALSAADMGTWRYLIATDEQFLDAGMRRLAGLPPDATALPLETFLGAVHEADRERVRAAFERCGREGDEIDIEFRTIWPDGSLHWLKDRGKALRGADGRLAILTGAAMDITDRKHLEEALHETDRRKDLFLATLGHELRNPLAPIRNACAILKLAGGSDPTVAAARDMIDRQTSHLVRLVDDLLDVSRITHGTFALRCERVALASVLERALEVARSSLDAAGQRLSVALPPARVVLEADPVRLAQVFINLIDNARKYTPEGGRIALTVTHADAEVVVEVADTGIGIAAEHLPHLFETFYQVPGDRERVPSGLGIGLALARGLVEMHGGTLSAHSDGPGRGSALRVHLPVASAPPLAAPMPADSPAPPSADGRVLVVDDQADVAESFAMLLRLKSVAVQTAHDGLEALAVAARFRPDLVLLDLGMPRLDGFETCRRLRAEPWGRALTVVAVTGWGQEDDRARSAAAGFDAHWTKPVDLAVVLERLAAIRAHQPPPGDLTDGPSAAAA